MYEYPELNELLNQYEKVKTYTFMVYGTPTEEQIDVINRGLFMRVVMATQLDKEKSVMICEKVDEEKARILGIFQGMRILFAFAQNDIDEELIVSTVLDGFKYLHFLCDYVGSKETESYV